MLVRAMISRRIPREKEKEALGIITELRLMASNYPGYVSGETLQNVEDPCDYLVISTWQSRDAWDIFVADPRRKELQGRIDLLQGRTTDYKVYKHPNPYTIPLGESMKALD